MELSRLLIPGVLLIFAPACSNTAGIASGQIDASSSSNLPELVVLPTETHGVVRGFVRDVETNEPVIYANVLIVGTTLGSMSLRTGEFAISGVTPGIYEVKAMGLGYKAETHVSFALTQNPDGLRQ